MSLGADEMLVRCLGCRASPVTLSLIDVLQRTKPRLEGLDCYELSSRGALVRYLGGSGASLTTSEFFDDVVPGFSKKGVLCQDVMRLGFPAGKFDLVTSTEVFEHVPDDEAGFREVHRVLKDGGSFVFTVPLQDGPTVTRARATPSGIVRLMPPEYHSDRLRGNGKVLCYRNYGTDIPDRLMAAGFSTARLERPARAWFGHSRVVVVAEKST